MSPSWGATFPYINAAECGTRSPSCRACFGLAFEMQKSKGPRENRAYHFWLHLNGNRSAPCLRVGRVWASFWISRHCAGLTWRACDNSNHVGVRDTYVMAPQRGSSAHFTSMGKELRCWSSKGDGWPLMGWCCLPLYLWSAARLKALFLQVGRGGNVPAE